ncbi:MAG: ABC transporter transmembrane domain-containing protein, partial [Gammaproteobacteria bacterium]
MRTTTASPAAARYEWQTIRTLIPYLWEFRSRVVFAMLLLVLAKLATVAVPLALKQIVDALDVARQPLLILPLGLLAGYGLLRLASALFGELRDAIFAKVTQRAMRRVALQVFRHLHALALRFHLERQTGGMTRDIERGTRGVQSLISYSLYSILPTIVEVGLVLTILA